MTRNRQAGRAEDMITTLKSHYDGTLPAAALTTVFTMPSSCFKGAVSSTRFHDYGCMPENFKAYFEDKIGYYSPAICPSGYASACERTSYGPSVEPLETAQICCPTGWSCVDGHESLCSSPPATSTSSSGDATTSAADSRAFAIQVRWQSSDLTNLATDPTVYGATYTPPSTVAAAWAGATATGTHLAATATHSSSSKNSSGNSADGGSGGSGGGMNTATKVCLGLGIPATVLALALLCYFLWRLRRRHRRRQEHEEIMMLWRPGSENELPALKFTSSSLSAWTVDGGGGDGGASGSKTPKSAVTVSTRLMSPLPRLPSSSPSSSCEQVHVAPGSEPAPPPPLSSSLSSLDADERRRFMLLMKEMTPAPLAVRTKSSGTELRAVGARTPPRHYAAESPTRAAALPPPPVYSAGLRPQASMVNLLAEAALRREAKAAAAAGGGCGGCGGARNGSGENTKR